MNWNELTVKKYYEITEIVNTETDPLVLNTRLIDTIWDVNSADLPYVQVINYINKLDFMKKPYEAKYPKKEYTVQGMKFSPILDLSKITTAQYIDFQTFLKAQDYKHILNCLFIKEGEEYGQNDYSDFLWENMTLDNYSDVLFFFRKSLVTLTDDTLRSSIKTMKKMLRKEKDKTKRMSILKMMIQLQQTRLQLNEAERFELTK